MRPERIILKDKTDLARIGRNQDAVLDGSLHFVADRYGTGVGYLETRNGTQQRRFTAARRTQEGKNAFVELEADVIESFEVFVKFSDTFNFYN